MCKTYIIPQGSKMSQPSPELLWCRSLNNKGKVIIVIQANGVSGLSCSGHGMKNVERPDLSHHLCI